MPRKNFKCTVAYNGAEYFGWQTQKNFVTVQGIIEFALQRIFRQEVRIGGASRTDSGVHALGQVFNFRVQTEYKDEEVKAMLNSILPDDITIKSVRDMPDVFNSRWDVRKKFYRYVIFTGKDLLPFYKGLCWHLKDKNTLDFNKMKELLPLFKGTKNYLSFSKAGSADKQYERSLDKVRLTKRGSWIFLDFESQGFLYQMVRKLTMVFVYYGLGRITKDVVEKMFEVQDRTYFSHIAPADGLYLVKIIYGEPGAGEEETSEIQN